ncbi:MULTISPECIES: SRPBCC domain-containing protein [unclassified Mesorhizobium]|uniref:SRPBCC family protein n=1 Tax=unclassified Mesorhizobium TaxID=325217 RepID=UPI0015E3C551|nr:MULTISPECIES: SRPBCC domain-containing protein [unclassified Mesorhizobium]
MKVSVSRVFDRPCEDVFAAWIDPQIVRLWLFVGPTNRIVDVDIEPVPGGRISIDERNDGRLIEHWGRFANVEPPHKLSFTLNVPKHFQGEALIDLDFARLSSGCRLTLTRTQAGPPKAEEIWRRMLDGLERIFNGQPAYRQ